MFIHFHVDEFAIMGVQMANFGGQEMLVGSCGEEQNLEARPRKTCVGSRF